MGLRSALLAFSFLVLPAAAAPPGPSLEGRVTYRTRDRASKPDIGAKVWLFRGKQALLLESQGRLAAFEKQFPRGVERVGDRSVEDDTRMAAMVLTTYDSLHRDDLAASASAGKDGRFLLRAPAPGTFTLVVESRAAAGSYHLQRYAVRVLCVGSAPAPPQRIDFGISHLEEAH
jgi:hypothetical protein